MAVREHLGRNLTFGMLDSLGRAIVAGAYDPGAFPTEAGLSRQYNVSRSVTREVVKMLSAKGLLSARPRQGVAIQPTARWNKFDPDVLRWMLSRRTSVELLIQFDQLRLAIEPEAAWLAASRAADPRELGLLADALSRIEAAVDLRATVDAHVDFHVIVLRASGNLMFAQFRGLIRTALHAPARWANGSASATACVANYIAVRDAIAGRSPVTARIHMRQIVNDSASALMNIPTPRN